MMTSPGFSVTQRAVEVLSSPQAQVLVCLDEGDQPSPSSCQTDAETLATAVRLLLDLGLVLEFAGADGRGDSLALTAKGLHVAGLVRDIGPLPVTDEQPVDR